MLATGFKHLFFTCQLAALPRVVTEPERKRVPLIVVGSAECEDYQVQWVHARRTAVIVKDFPGT